MPTIGAWTVDAADGTLQPARGVEVIPQPDPDPPVVDTSRAQPVPSTIVTATAVANDAAALALAADYHAAIGTVVAFRGVDCFVADVTVGDPRAAAASKVSTGAVVVATWTLYASAEWLPA